MAQVPDEETQPSIGEQLDAAITESGMSITDLARKLSSRTSSVQSERRWIYKVLREETDPEPESVAALEEALGVPAGFFVRPSPQQEAKRLASLSEIRRHLEERGAEWDALLDALHDGQRLRERDSKLLRRDYKLLHEQLDELRSRIERLEAAEGAGREVSDQ